MSNSAVNDRVTMARKPALVLRGAPSISVKGAMHSVRGGGACISVRGPQALVLRGDHALVLGSPQALVLRGAMH